jgi:hypothetical protein
MKGTGIVSKRIALGFIVAAAAVPVAQAADRPDDRAGPLGVAPAASAQTPAVRPDDRAGPLGVGEAIASQPTSAVRPDDRAGIRGVGYTEPATQSLRPDDRPGPLGVGDVSTVSAPSNNDFDWGDWAIGLVAGLGIALGMAGALILAVRRSPGVHKTDAAAAG